MALPKNVVWRARTAYIRVEVPADIRDAVGKKVIFESLRTKDSREAARLGLQRLAELHNEWAEIRARTNPTPDDLRRIAHVVYLDKLEEDRQKRANFATGPEVAEIAAQTPPHDGQTAELSDAQLALLTAMFGAEEYQTDRESTRAALRSGLRDGHPTALGILKAKIDAEADKAIARERLNVPKGSPAYRDLSLAIRRAWLEALDRAAERDAGDWGGKPKDEIVTLPAAPDVPTAAPGETVMEMFDKYERINPNGIKADTLDYSRKCVALFADSLTPGFPASAITKKTVIEWQDLLRDYPVKAAEIREFKGLSMREVIELNKKLKRPTLSKKTINKYLSALGGFCNWLVRRSVIDANPTKDLYDKIDKTENRVRSYSTEELNRIFASPVFTGAASTADDATPGNVIIRDHRYWLPLIALFTGCRLGEIAQLLTDDVRVMHDRHVFVITTEGDATKTVKNAKSQRVIPVHRELVRLGFLDFHRDAVTAERKRLFPEIKPDARGQISGNVSRWYGRYLARVGIKTDKSVNFHSFRHGLADACRRAGFLDNEFRFILGHADPSGGVTKGYGILPEGNLRRRVEIIDRVEFPGLDLKHLFVK